MIVHDHNLNVHTAVQTQSQQSLYTLDDNNGRT